MSLLNLSTLLLPVILVGCAATQYPAVSHDGLQLLPESKIDAAYKKEGADFSGYKRFLLADCEVAFKRNWQRDQNQTRSLFSHVDSKDMAKIKADLSELCRSTFTNELSGGGYTLVNEAAPDVLVLRPAVVDLDIAAPDVGVSARTTSYVTSAGSMRLTLELEDSLSGEILARAIDKKKARENGRITWANSVSNRVEAKRMFQRWSKMLVKSMDKLKNG